MSLQKFSGTDDTPMTGFVVTDLDTAEHADGIVRCAKKILQDGAKTMARSRTYSWALLGQKVSGASAAINVEPADRAAGIADFVAQVRPSIESGTLSLDAGKGIGASELSGLEAVDRRSALRLEPTTFGTLADELLVISVTTSAVTALGDTDGRTVAIEGAGTNGPALVEALTQAGLTVVAVGTSKGTLSNADGLDAAALVEAWTASGEDVVTVLADAGDSGGPATVLEVDADVLICGSKIGLVDHDGAAALDVKVVVPIGVAPVTAKALAVAGRRDIIVLPDFLTLAGPLVSFRPTGDLDAEGARGLARTEISTFVGACIADERGAYLAACELAERFLSTWVDELPFGRPLA